jgi:hypothetical protein
MATTVTIYSPDGTVLNTISEPTTWSFDNKNVFWVTFPESPGGPTTTLGTTLPVVVETTQ